MTVAEFNLESEAHTQALAKAVAAVIRPQDCVTLSGTLGAGKTTFMRYFLQALGHEGAVLSPSFMILQSYDLAIGSVHHVDAYRIEDSSECEELGLGELLAHDIVCIEWPEICADWLPKDAININIDSINEHRRVKIAAFGREDELERVTQNFHEFAS